MINWLHSKLHSPSSGWDPVPAEWARTYAEKEWSKLDESCLDQIESWIGTFKGKRVIDLGGGPGHYTVAMARRGAEVTWHDVSNQYLKIARTKAQENKVSSVKWSLGYLEEAYRVRNGGFDLVFNRICWNYCRSDGGFAKLIWELLKPGAVAYIDANNTLFTSGPVSLPYRIRSGVNRSLGFKVGHPMPPKGRIAALINEFPIEKIMVDYSFPGNDRILFRKAF